MKLLMTLLPFFDPNNIEIRRELDRIEEMFSLFGKKEPAKNVELMVYYLYCTDMVKSNHLLKTWDFAKNAWVEMEIDSSTQTSQNTINTMSDLKHEES